MRGLSNQTWGLSNQMLRLITAWKMGKERNNYLFLTNPRGITPDFGNASPKILFDVESYFF